MKDESWVCAVCGREKAEGVFQPTLSVGIKSSWCFNCNDRRLYRHPTGEELRANGIALVARANGDYMTKARWGIKELADRGKPFTADDLTDLIGLPEHRNAVGAAISGAAKAGIIRLVGWRRGGRASQHARRISEWEGV